MEFVPLKVTSGPVKVKQGQMVRIHGWINVPKVIGGTHDGLMIVDSLGGEKLAERIPVTSGWQEFTLYRGVPNSGPMQIEFRLTGFGSAMLDEVTIRSIDMNQVRQARR